MLKSINHKINKSSMFKIMSEGSLMQKNNKGLRNDLPLFNGDTNSYCWIECSFFNVNLSFLMKATLSALHSKSSECFGGL